MELKEIISITMSVASMGVTIYVITKQIARWKTDETRDRIYNIEARQCKTDDKIHDLDNRFIKIETVMNDVAIKLNKFIDAWQKNN